MDRDWKTTGAKAAAVAIVLLVPTGAMIARSYVFRTYGPDEETGTGEEAGLDGTDDVPDPSQMETGGGQAPYGLVLEDGGRDRDHGAGEEAGVLGVVVRTVSPESPAARSGIQPGDVIVEVDGQPANDPATVIRAIDISGKTYVPLDVERYGQRRLMVLHKTEE